MRRSWFSHIAVRYAAMLVAATLLLLAIVVNAYDRYASGLLDVISGTRAERRIAVMHGRLTSFLEARFAQLDTVANDPDLPLAFADRRGSPAPGVCAVLGYEADDPDLCDILVFNGQDKLIDAATHQIVQIQAIGTVIRDDSVPPGQGAAREFQDLSGGTASAIRPGHRAPARQGPSASRTYPGLRQVTTLA